MSYREFQPTYNIKIWDDTSFFGRVNCGMSAAMSSLIFLHLAAFLNKILENNIFHEINNKYWTICCIFYPTACTATWFYMHLKIMGFQNNQTFLATNIFFEMNIMLCFISVVGTEICVAASKTWHSWRQWFCFTFSCEYVAL